MEEEKKTRQEGMTRRGKIILTVFAGAIIVFLIWWLIPRSFEGITGMKGIQPQKISCTIQPADIEATPLQITVTDSDETAPSYVYAEPVKEPGADTDAGEKGEEADGGNEEKDQQ